MDAAPTADFAEADSLPCPVAQLIAFDFWDVALGGVLETRSGRAYRFEFLDVWPDWTSDGAVRIYQLRPLAPDAFRRIVDLITPHCATQWPYWIPSWWHLVGDAKRKLDAAVDTLVDSAGLPAWVVASDGGLLADDLLRVRPADSRERGRDEWAGYLGLISAP